MATTKQLSKAKPKELLADTLVAWREWTSQPEEVQTKEIFDFISTGGSVRGFAKRKGFPEVNLRHWVQKTPDRLAQYASARDVRADSFIESIAEILDEPLPRVPTTGAIDSAAVNYRRLIVDTLKWQASKLAPKRYGEKLEVEAKVQHDVVGDLAAFLMGAGSRLPVKDERDIVDLKG